ncbi:MAG TPA: UDP-glucuronic acid decarboxylase family protein [Candidatus Dormibacteraeota bacterium]
MSGGAGFIGSHLCQALLESGWEVVVLDNLITGRQGNLAGLDVSFLKHDVSRPFSVEGPVDAVFHFASPASPVDFPEVPIQIIKVGTLGTHNMLGLALAKKARFLLASTSEVYGDPLVHPQPESYYGNVNPIGPRGCYDEAKRAAEAFTMAYNRARGVDTRIVRIFNTYGPRMRVDDGRFIPNFFRQALRGEPLTVYGQGDQTRSVCYVDDLVRGVLAVYENGDEMPFNLGTEYEVTVLEMAELIKMITGSSSQVEFGPLPQDDPKQRRPDLTRARALLGFEPKVAVEDGLRRTMEYFKSAL